MEVRKCAVHKCVCDFPEIDKKPGIGDPKVGNSDSVNRRTLPVRRSSLGAGQTVNRGENRSHSFLTQVRPKGTTATSDVDSKRKIRHYSTQSSGRHEH